MDTLLRNATVVDGTGEKPRGADVLISGDRIAAVGASGTLDHHEVETLDLSGLVLAPGFIDIHTHYDAQVSWDPDFTPSCWHGVTTVVMGNCGFGVVPTRPADRDTILRTLENVEGMSYDALHEGVSWDFESLPDYLGVMRSAPKRLNVGVLVGHTPLRLYVLGDDATERSATAKEVRRMCALLDEAMAAGALGFATSKLPTHVGAEGKPVPSRSADVLEEIGALADVLGARGEGVIQAAFGPGFFVEEFAEISRRTGRPLTWTALLAGMGRKGKTFEILDRADGLGGTVWPQVACRPLVMQVTLEDPFPFGSVKGFGEVLKAERRDRPAVYADAAWRDQVRPQVDQEWKRRWAKTTVQESTVHPGLVDGPSLGSIAEQRGEHPFDVMCDLAMEEGLQTRFRVVLTNDDEEEVGALLQDPRVILGLSDAGAHASQLCDACFSTHLLGHWVRDKEALTLEQAVWRLSGQPADFLGLDDRGKVAPGCLADLVAFDPQAVGPGPLERIHDLPGGADRLVARGVGVEHIWVAGEAIRSDGRDLDVRPGKLIDGSSASGIR